MPVFKYKVSNKAGKTFAFDIEGEDEKDSMKRVRARGLIPLECYGDASKIGKKKLSLKFWNKSSFDIYEFSNRLVPLLQAHIQLERALSIMSDGTDEGPQKEVITAIRRGLHEGKKFSEMIKSLDVHFPPIYANLAEAGEESGAMTQVITELQHFLNYKKEMTDFMVTSSIYPAIILCVTFAVIILLFTVFVPKFTKIFFDMGRPLPLPTQMMVWISDFIKMFWWLWLLIIGGIFYFISRVKKGGKPKQWWDKKIVKVPVLGALIQTMEIGRYVKTLAVLIKNNVHLINTVRISTKVIQNTDILESFANVNNELKGGKKLSKALGKSLYMPKIVIQMLEIGEESGDIGGMLQQVSDELEKDMKTKIKKLLALFEPAVILFLALVVLTVVISIFLAIMEMNNI